MERSEQQAIAGIEHPARFLLVKNQEALIWRRSAAGFASQRVTPQLWRCNNFRYPKPRILNSSPLIKNRSTVDHSLRAYFSDPSVLTDVQFSWVAPFENDSALFSNGF